MSKNQGLIELSLTREQQERMWSAARKTSLAGAPELSVLELEERIAPGHRMG